MFPFRPEPTANLRGRETKNAHTQTHILFIDAVELTGMNVQAISHTSSAHRMLCSHTIPNVYGGCSGSILVNTNGYCTRSFVSLVHAVWMRANRPIGRELGS